MDKEQGSDDRYSQEEAQRRFEAITRAVLNMRPEPRKAVVGKVRESNRKRVAVNAPQPAEGKARS